eukprot:TRINITY_DN3245_c0_g1_i6.p3 TRINITY_DN3245_c0_g1~~TRINITY_DN3245_c0_g1_i6.p3  ORF type:complete len:131 (+),score=25.88 TRINITY_DN3245_c0_g1_i6:165-557(+)
MCIRDRSTQSTWDKKRKKNMWFVYLGIGFVAVGLAGKSTIRLLRMIRTKRGFVSSMRLGKYYKGGFDAMMSEREAQLILNVKRPFTEQNIKEAHKKMMMINHPDKGGSTFIANKVNEAKDKLMSFGGIQL